MKHLIFMKFKDYYKVYYLPNPSLLISSSLSITSRESVVYYNIHLYSKLSLYYNIFLCKKLKFPSLAGNADPVTRV